MWCHGPDGFIMWRSQQTPCYDLPGVRHYKLQKTVLSYSLVFRLGIKVLLVIDAACRDCWPCRNSQPYPGMGN